MPEQKGPVHLRGKSGGMVYSAGKYGDRASVAPELTQKQKKEIASRPQNLRTGYLNNLGRGILNAVKYHAGCLVPGPFFNNMLSLFREEKTNHRVLLLEKLRGMDVHRRYQFGDACPIPKVELKVGKTFYTIEVEFQAPAYHGDATCFYLDIILFTWNKDEDHCRHDVLSTEWMNTGVQGVKYCTMKLKRKAEDTEFLLACRCVKGVNHVENGWTNTAMYFVGSGPLTEEGRKIVSERRAEEEAVRNAPPVKAAVREKKRVQVRDKKK